MINRCLHLLLLIPCKANTILSLDSLRPTCRSLAGEVVSMRASLVVKPAEGKQVPAGSLWMYVIAVLSHEPIHAYGVRVRLRERFGVKVPTSTVYTVLYKLVDEGLVERIEIDGETLYKATPEGLKTLREAIKLLKDLTEKIESEARL